MKTQIVINISYWNEKIDVDSTVSELTMYKDIIKPYPDIQEELRELILENKNDGFQFDIFEHYYHGVIIIELFYDIENKGEEINIDYIKNYFNNFYDIDKKIYITNNSSFDNFISLRIYDNDLVIEKELKNLDVEMETVKKYHVYEWGAGDYGIEIICYVLTNVGVDLILTAIKSKSKETYNSIQKTGKSNQNLIPLIKEYLLQNHDISPVGLKIGEIVTFEDYYYVDCHTRNEKIEIEWSKQNEMKGIKIIQFNNTKI